MSVYNETFPGENWSNNFTNSCYSDCTESEEPMRHPLFIVIPITVIYVFIFTTGLIGNISTCFVISRNKSMHTATNYYLFSLAISDLLLLVTGLPPEIYMIWYHPYVFGEFFCIFRGMAAETSTNATVLTITAFTVERYVAICHPFLSHTMSKLSRAIKWILTIWMTALAFAIPQALQFGIIMYKGNAVCTQTRTIIEHSFEISTFLFFVTPMVLITLLYSLIGLRLKNSNMIKHERPTKHLESSRSATRSASGTLLRSQKCVGSRKVTANSSRRVLKMLIAVVVAFFICWAPFHVQRLVYIYGTLGHTPKSTIMQTVYIITTYISGILYYLSTTINPFLYHIMSVKFREAFKETFEAGVQCKGQWKEGEAWDEKQQQRLQPQPGDAHLGVAGQIRSDHNSNPNREENPHWSTARANRAGCRRNSGGTEPVTSSSYIKSRTLSMSFSHDAVLILQNHKNFQCCGHSNNTNDIYTQISSSHIHYFNNNTNVDTCHICMKTNGCCLDKFTIREKESKFTSLWRSIKCGSDGKKFVNGSFTRAIKSTITVENETQTEPEILNASFYNVGSAEFGEPLKDELSSYMEEVRRREKLDIG